MEGGSILTSLEMAAERGGDITSLVYEKLFSAHPEMLPLFVRDRNGAVRGEMLSRTLEALLDYLGPDHYASNMFRCEVVTHSGYGVPPDVFPAFFTAITATLREVLKSDWDYVLEADWSNLLADLRAITAAA